MRTDWRTLSSSTSCSSMSSGTATRAKTPSPVQATSSADSFCGRPKVLEKEPLQNPCFPIAKPPKTSEISNRLRVLALCQRCPSACESAKTPVLSTFPVQCCNAYVPTARGHSRRCYLVLAQERRKETTLIWRDRIAECRKERKTERSDEYVERKQDPKPKSCVELQNPKP